MKQFNRGHTASIEKVSVFEYTVHVAVFGLDNPSLRFFFTIAGGGMPAKASHRHFFRQWLDRWALRSITGLALLLVVSSIVEIPVFSYYARWLHRLLTPETTGYIYVESPEVYTRERLVNDRYDQDHWLKSQLKRTRPVFDDNGNPVPPQLVARYMHSEWTAGEAGNEDPPEPADGIAGNGSETVSRGSDGKAQAETLGLLDLKTEFKVTAAIRDLVRQGILENSLDDRHDLTGNTLFGLKFDTAVIPGSNTFLSPVVLISMDADLFSDSRDEGSHAGSDDVFRKFVISSPGSVIDGIKSEEIEAKEVFDLNAEYLEKWRGHVEHKLNTHMGQDCGNMADSPSAGISGTVEKEGLFDDPESVVAVSFSRPATRPEESSGGGASQDRRAAKKYLIPKEIYDNTKKKIGDSFEYLFGIYGGRIEYQSLYDSEERPSDWYESKYVRMPFTPGPEFAKYFEFLIDTSKALSDQCRIFPVKVKLSERNAFFFRGDLSEVTFSDYSWSLVELGETEGSDKNSEKTYVIAKSAEFDDRGSMSLAHFAAEFQGEIEDIAEKKNKSACAKRDPFNAHDTGGQVASCFVLSGGGGAGWPLKYESGRSEFLNTVRSAGAYAYAVFPKSDVAGVIENSRRGAGFSIGGLFGLSGLSESAESKAEIDVINFATGKNADIHFDFGWMFLDAGRQEANQLSQTVLVSVPAFLTELPLTVRTGWVEIDDARNVIDNLNALERCENRRRNQERRGITRYNGPSIFDKTGHDASKNDTSECGDEPAETGIEEMFKSALKQYRKVSLTVPLPPDYEALGSLIGPGEGQRRPRVKDRGSERDGDGATTNVSVEAGEPASFVVEGVRLWRSTVVTLDGQAADRIQVLPDMNGIIASFDTVSSPYIRASADKADEKPKCRNADLKIWTSEGSVDSKLEVEICRPAAYKNAEDRNTSQ